MSKLLTKLVAYCLFLLFVCIPVSAQSSTATLSGAIQDEYGAVIPGAAIAVVNEATSFKRTATTNNSGSFTVPLLPPGEYTVLVERDGFTRVQLTNIVLNVGDQKAVQVQLKVGDIASTVEVRPDASLVRTDGSVGTVVDQQFVKNIPLNGRSFQSLITLTPGVVVVPAGAANLNGGFSVNGQRTTANTFIVDGVSGNVGISTQAPTQSASASGNLPSLTAAGTTQSLASAEELQEFSVQTSSYAAEYGRQPGGQISISTRSGGNQFHGSLFDYVRNEKFDANDWFANANGQPRAPLRQNIFGGSFSGPVFLPNFGEGGPRWYNGRNRMFFFFSYEGTRLLLPKFALTNVPSLCIRGQTASCPAGFAPAAAVLQPALNLFPVPNGRDLINPNDGLPNGFAESASSYSDPSTVDSTSIRIDHHFKNNWTLFGRYNQTPSSSESLSTSNLNVNSIRANETRSLTVGLTSLMGPRISNDLRVNFTDSKGTFSSEGGESVRSIFIPSNAASDRPIGFTFQFFNIPGFTASGAGLSSSSSTNARQRQLNVVDGVTFVVGDHQLKFGADYRKAAPLILNNDSLIWSFTSRQALQNGIAFEGLWASSLPKIEPIYHNFSAFAQDAWKVSSRLTLTLGLRWEVNPPPDEANGFLPLAVDQIDDLATMRLEPLDTKLWKTTYNNFAPRIGVAYQLFKGEGRETVLRGGFGVYYDTGNEFSARPFAAGFPFNVNQSQTGNALRFPLDPALVRRGTLGIFSSLPSRIPDLVSIFNPELELPYTLSWNVAVERSIGKSQSLSVSYVGNRGERLLQYRSLPVPSTNPGFGRINLTTNNATSNYHAMHASFQRRLSRGLQALASYAWAHAIDEDSAGNTNRAIKRGNSNFDIRQVFAAATTYDIPSPSVGKIGNLIFRNWSLDSRVQIQSAPPIDVIASAVQDPVTGEATNRRPNVIPKVPIYLSGDQYPGGRLLNNASYTVADNAMLTAAGCLWVARPPGNTTAPIGPARGAFCTPAGNSLGNLGRNEIRGLPLWQVDLSLRREFSLTEKLNLQLRAEAFNVFNHPNFGTIQTNLSAANFGFATNMLNRQLGSLNQLYQIGGPRSMQFAARMSF